MPDSNKFRTPYGCYEITESNGVTLLAGFRVRRVWR